MIIDFDQFQEIFSTIRKNRLRTFLTGFSVAWGIFMLIILLGSGTGLEKGVKSLFKDATNSVWVRKGQTSLPYKGLKPGGSIQFTNVDYNDVKTTVKGIEHITARFYRWEIIKFRTKMRPAHLTLFRATLRINIWKIPL